MDSKPGSLYLGAYALCIDPKDRLLLVRVSPGHADAGCWTLPGGGLDWGEEPRDGLLRELLEETGLHVLGGVAVIDVFSYVYPGDERRGSFHHVGLIYRVEQVNGQLTPETNGSTDRCQWFFRLEAMKLPLAPLGVLGVAAAWPGG